MSRGWLEFQDVTFRHDGTAEPLFSSLSFRLEEGFAGVIGANGAGKTTLLRLAAGELVPASGRVLRPEPVAFCPQRTDAPPPGLRELLEGGDRRALAFAARLRVEPDWLARWPTLSHGERKRAQVAVALAGAPLLLLLDEPTNHVDREARDLVLGALRGFAGAALVVSHDRDLLDTLCVRCVFLEGDRLTIRPGGWTAAVDLARRDAETERRSRERLGKEVDRLDAEAARRRQAADKVARGLSKRRVGKKDRDAKAKIDAARLTGRDRAAAKRTRNVERRADRTRELFAAAEARRERRLGIDLPGERSARPVLLTRPAGEIALGGGRRLVHPDLAIGSGDRVGITGPNGTGKSTLFAALLDGADLPPERVVRLPQEIPEEEGARVLDEIRARPGPRRGEILTIVARLGSDPERVLLTPSPSPGETRKLLLALGLSRSPWLVALDEPTNHLDLPSVECLEDALAGFPGALILVSHDERFLASLATSRWTTRPTPAGAELNSR